MDSIGLDNAGLWTVMTKGAMMVLSVNRHQR
jgi:hypothetical protein